MIPLDKKNTPENQSLGIFGVIDELASPRLLLTIINHFRSVYLIFIKNSFSWDSCSFTRIYYQD